MLGSQALQLEGCHCGGGCRVEKFRAAFMPRVNSGFHFSSPVAAKQSRPPRGMQ